MQSRQESITAMQHLVHCRSGSQDVVHATCCAPHLDGEQEAGPVVVRIGLLVRQDSKGRELRSQEGGKGQG